MEAESSRSNRPFGRTVVVVFLVMTCLHVWVGAPPILPKAEAQIPDAGLQRKLLLEEVQRTNDLLRDIKQILLTQPLNVRVVGADNQADRAAAEK